VAIECSKCGEVSYAHNRGDGVDHADCLWELICRVRALEKREDAVLARLNALERGHTLGDCK
jgi:hypothetical protein